MDDKEKIATLSTPIFLSINQAIQKEIDHLKETQDAHIAFNSIVFACLKSLSSVIAAAILTHPEKEKEITDFCLKNLQNFISMQLEILRTMQKEEE